MVSYAIAKIPASGYETYFMKRLLFVAVPLILLVFAFRPVHFHTVSGTIADDKGSPIPNVSVRVKGTTTGVISKSDGTYNILLPDANGTLIFSAVGYEKKEVRVNGRATINVSLSASSTKTTEVVVTGLGKKQDMYARGYTTSPMASNNYMYSPTVSTDYKASYDKSYYLKDEVGEEYNREGYDKIVENRFLKVTDNPLSTFSIDVDAASYSNIRRFLNNGQLPPEGAVRIEEMVNYFTYDYPQPNNDQPFSINTEISDAPWNKDHKLVLLGLQGKKIPTDNLPPSNLVFLIDLSGSMW